MPDMNFIMVVEDDPILKNLLGHTFAGKYQTLYASNGAEALALFDQYKPALVLLDLMLPDMDGFTILQKIREHTDETKNVPVIIVSNLGQQADKDKAMGLGANEYIVKAEVDVDEIINHIQKFLPGSDAAAPAAPAAPAPEVVTMPAVPAEVAAALTPEPPAPPVEGTEEKPFVI